MPVGHILMRCSLVGLALIISAGASAAGLTCSTNHEGYRCEAWPQGERYRYEWHLADATAGDGARDTALRQVRCSERATIIAVSIIAPAGYVETATRRLPGCADIGRDGTAQALAAAIP